MMTKETKAKMVSKFFYKWHYRIGIIAAIFLILITVSGMLLNHDRELGLRNVRLSNDFLQGRYGASPDDIITAFRVASRWVSWFEGDVYFNNIRTLREAYEVVGAVEYDGMIVAASTNEMFLFSPEGEVLERVKSTYLPMEGISAIGLADGGVAIESDGNIFKFDEDLGHWYPFLPGETLYISSRSGNIPSQIADVILSGYEIPSFSLSKILLDIHTGRIIFGKYYKIFLDIVAIALLALIFTGIYNWVKLQRHAKKSSEK